MPDNKNQQDVPFFVSKEEEEEEIFSSVGQSSPPPSAPPSYPPQTQPPNTPPPMPTQAARNRPPTTGGFRSVPQQQGYYLEVSDEQGNPLPTISLTQNRTIIGKSPHSDAHYDSPLLSSWHAALTQTQEGKILLEDLQSTNGVYLGIADDFQLEDGDMIALGRQRFVFRTTTPPPTLHDPHPHQDAPLIGAASQGHYPHIIKLLQGGLIGGLYPLQKPIIIGRNQADVPCPEDFTMEEHHARIERQGPHFILKDLGSRTGSYIRVYNEVELFAGDRFVLGHLQFCLRHPNV